MTNPTWIDDRLPAEADADLHGQVRWGMRMPGMLMPWDQVRPGEPWARSAAWRLSSGADATDR